MPTSVTLPALGESVTEGTITRWLKQPGDSVEVDEPLLEVSTDKVDTEIPSPAAGTLLEVKVGEDETVEVGAELAVIGDASQSGGDGGGAQETAEQSGAAEQPAAEGQPDAGERPDEQAQQPAPETPQETEPADQPPESDASQPSGGAAEGTPVTLPALGESVTEGTITRWLKQVGDSVQTDEPLVEVSTDKVDTEIPSPASGVLLEISVNEDETVQVGAQLAVIGAEGAQSAAAPRPEPQPEQPEPQRAQQPELQAEQQLEPQRAQQPEPQPPAPTPAAGTTPQA
ncbi:MAG: 2-oxoglutarate dehydrogenase, E2 component, dihydrolipoamide succinyltransferase, partial [Actinomycetota bacterium]|nr:2-oxoglutarate dehydrogenase, E2 component, dihydrolipoamide succinyltransferase [Actinomycetota bacterium]